MGVPKFFRWISERYPTLSTKVDSEEVPEFDNLYLDMNGIIHPCSHPSDDATFTITEKQIFDNIFGYIEFLIQTIKPLKTFFLAVDGVAPRAKMNQQRARRFSSAREAKLKADQARHQNKILPDDKDKFDSNTITPGTSFMDRLDKALRYFIIKRISENNPVWVKPEIIYSGHQTPGEGEHKIADYIRYIRSNKNYDGKLRHCLYGLDADLVHLSLASHEKNFSLLREEVVFNTKSRDRNQNLANKKIVRPENIKFYLLSISILRDYLQLHEYPEFKEINGYIKSRIIDDWIFLNFLIGNDFIPHIPHLHIKMQHIPDLIECHKYVLRSKKDYLINDGIINLDIFRIFIEKFSKFDLDSFENIEADSKWLQGKSSRNKTLKKSEIRNVPTNSDIREKEQGGKKSHGIFASEIKLSSDSEEIDMSNMPI